MTKCTTFVKFGLLLALCLSVAACHKEAERKGETSSSPKPPVVSDARTDLVLAYDTPDGPAVVSRVEDVPAEARGAVRVQDPTQPPEARDPSWVFVADLSAKAADGTYAVQAMRRDAYDKSRMALRPKVEASETATAAAGGGAAAAGGGPAAAAPESRVVMYATKHCPVCIKARRWLLDKGIPYVERDVEEDAAAAASLASKGRAQGVPTTGVPVFEVDGKLVPGFDPSVILRLWNAKINV